MNTLKGARLKWAEVFEDPNLTLDSLKARAVSEPSNLGIDGIRSVCWKVYLSCLPSIEISSWPMAMNTARERYEGLRRKYIRTVGGADEPEPDLEVNNPLSLAEDSPWQQFFMDSELRKIIKQDVERTLPDNDYFRSEKVQERLNDILFIYCKINHDVSYRQGMHELVAHILWVVSSESLDIDSEPSDASDATLDVMKSVLDSKYIEHDTFILFSSLMSRAKPWYEFSDEAPGRKLKPNVNNHTQLFGRSEAPEPPPGKQTPVIEWSMRIFDHLERIDNELFLHLKSYDIQPQLFGIRWFRLLFGREFPMEDVLNMWDGIFAKDPSLDICIFIGLAMLLRIRDDLLEQEFAGCLQKLMRYPPVKDVHLFIPQALNLQRLPNAAGGYEIIRQNSSLSGKPLPPLPPEAAEAENQQRVGSPSPYSRQSHQSSQHPQAHHGDHAKGQTSGFSGNGVFGQHIPALDAIKPVAEGFVNVTKNVLESKGGAALNKAIHDMKKNTQSYIRKGNTQTSSPPDTGFPPNIEQTIAANNRVTPSHHPIPPQQRNQSSHVGGNSSSKELQAQLGQIVAKALVILDTELVSKSKTTGDDTEKVDQDTPKTPTKEYLAAISGLEHVRDILLGLSKDINPLVIESKMLDAPADTRDNTSEDVAQGNVVAPVPSTPAPSAPVPSAPKSPQDPQSATATSGVQQRRPVNAAPMATAAPAPKTNSPGAVQAGSPTRPAQDTSNERRSPSRTSSYTSAIPGQGHRFASSAPALQPTTEPSTYSPLPPTPPPAPKPFSFDDLIDDTPTEPGRSSSPSLSAPRGSGIPSRIKSPRSSLTNSQFSWMLSQDSNSASTAGSSILGGGVSGSTSSPSLSGSPRIGTAGPGTGGGRLSSEHLPSATSRMKIDPLAGKSSARPKGSAIATGHGLPSVVNQQGQDDDPLRS